MTISRVKFPWPPFFRIFIFFDEVFNTARGTTYLMRDDGATDVNVRPSRVIWSCPNPTDLSVQPRKAVTRKQPPGLETGAASARDKLTALLVACKHHETYLEERICGTVPQNARGVRMVMVALSSEDLAHLLRRPRVEVAMATGL